MQQTAKIIDLSSYRKTKQASASPDESMPMMSFAPFAWVPVWVMVPVPMLAMGGPT